MNPFQKQLLLKHDRSMAELDNPERDGIGQPLPPLNVSVEEFEQCCNNCEVCGIRLTPEDIQRWRCTYCKNAIPYSPCTATNKV